MHNSNQRIEKLGRRDQEKWNLHGLLLAPIFFSTCFCRTGRCGNFFANSHPAYYKFYRFQGAHFSRGSKIWDKNFFSTCFCWTGRCDNFFANSHPAYYKFYRFQGAHFSRGSRISQKGGAGALTPESGAKTYYLTRLHENERNWTKRCRGGDAYLRPLDPPMHLPGIQLSATVLIP